MNTLQIIIRYSLFIVISDKYRHILSSPQNSIQYFRQYSISASSSRSPQRTKKEPDRIDPALKQIDSFLFHCHLDLLIHTILCVYVQVTCAFLHTLDSSLAVHCRDLRIGDLVLDRSVGYIFQLAVVKGFLLHSDTFCPALLHADALHVQGQGLDVGVPALGCGDMDRLRRGKSFCSFDCHHNELVIYAFSQFAVLECSCCGGSSFQFLHLIYFSTCIASGTIDLVLRSTGYAIPFDGDG